MTNWVTSRKRFLGLFRIIERLTHIEDYYVETSILDPMLEDLKRRLLEKDVKNKYAKKLTGRFKNVNLQKNQFRISNNKFSFEA